MSIGNNGGRPAHFETAEDLQKLVEDYFLEVEEKDSVVTVTGLALALGFCSRQSIYDYIDKDEFSYTMKRAMLFVECSYEKKACGNNATGPIFVLKNMGWSDKQEIKQELTVSGAPLITFSDTTHKEE